MGESEPWSYHPDGSLVYSLADIIRKRAAVSPALIALAEPGRLTSFADLDRGPVPGLVGAAAGCLAHRGGPGETRTKEHQMNSNARPGTRILGSLRSADGTGVVRIEDRYDTDIDDLWLAITDPGRVALVRAA